MGSKNKNKQRRRNDVMGGTSSGNTKIMSDDNTDWKKALDILKAELKADVVAANESQKKINQIVTAAFGTLGVVALLLVGASLLKALVLDEREKNVIRSDLQTFAKTFASDEMKKATDQLKVELQGAINTSLLPQINRQNQINGANTMAVSGYLDLITKDYLNATVRFTKSSSFFLMGDDEQSVQNTLNTLIKGCLPNLKAEHLTLEASAHFGVPVSQHLTNLMTQLQAKNETGRYNFSLAELRKEIGNIQTRR